jgi:predicted MFS family arabinose efflux permease
VAESVESGGQPKGPRFWLELVTNWRVIALCLAGGLTYGPLIGIMGQLQPILTDRGIAASMAAELRGLLAVAVFAATILTGLLLDRLWAPLVGFLATLGPVLGCFLLVTAHSPLALGVSIFLIGFAQGAEINIVAYLTARYFGMRSYSTIYGLSVMVISLFSAAGGSLFGQAYDRFGDYKEVLLVGAGCFALSAFCYLALGRYPAAPGKAVVQPVGAEPRLGHA